MHRNTKAAAGSGNVGKRGTWYGGAGISRTDESNKGVTKYQNG